MPKENSKKKKRDKYDNGQQLKNELHGLIQRHRFENDVRLMDAIAILEIAKYELLASDADDEEDQDGQDEFSID